MVSTIWISLRRPLTKDGRSGLSMSRQVRIASSEGRPSRRKKRAGNPAHRVHPLFHVYGEREKVQVVLWLLGRGGGGQDDGLAIQRHHGGAGRLTGQPARLEPDCMYAKFAVVDNGFSVVDTLHG